MWGCVCVCARVRTSQYSNRREFDLHVGVLELTQACLHWDKSSGLTGILKRSELSLTQTHTHKAAYTIKVSMHISPYTKTCAHKHTFTHMHLERQRVHAKTVNHVKLKEKCVRSLPISFRDWLNHTQTHTSTKQHTDTHAHTQVGQLPKIPGAGSFCLVLFFTLLPHTHKHTHRQGHWCIKLFWSVYRLWLVAVLLAKKVFFPL